MNENESTVMEPPSYTEYETQLQQIRKILDSSKVPTEIEDHALGGKRHLSTVERVKLIAHNYEVSLRVPGPYGDRW